MRALLIEQNAMMRDILSDYLERSAPGLTVVPARSVPDGIDQARSGDAFDVIIADLDSTTGRGLDDLAALQGACGSVPIVLLSQEAEPHAILDAYRRGIAAFVSKKGPGRILSLALQLVLSGEKFIPSAILSAIPSDGAFGQDDPPASTHGAQLATLTQRERDVLGLLFEGLSNAEIARPLAIKPNTVRLYVSGVLRKLGARNRLQAVRIAAHLGFRAKRG